jgi:hypothetical protein
VKISLAREALLGQLQTVSRVASTRSAIQAFARLSLIRAVWRTCQWPSARTLAFGALLVGFGSTLCRP